MRDQVVGYLFAGQGSQYAGMGKDLYEAFPESKAAFEKADKVLGFPISRIIFEGPQEELTRTQNCQPAILTMSIAAWEAFKAGSGLREAGSGYAAGLSLGEYSALAAAEAISFEDALYLVRRRGEFMEEEALKHPGSMASILGLDLGIIRGICKKTNTEVANINCPGQIVISGATAEVKEAERLAQEEGAKRVILLEVSGAFHSSFMKGAALKLAAEFEQIKISPPKIPVISNVTAQPVTSPDEIRKNLIQQVSCGVLWEDSMKFMLSKGVVNFREFGPGKVLKGLMRRISENAEVINIEKKEDIFHLRSGSATS